MSSTLLLRLAAPRQSWGEVGTERTRPTAKIPTFTGLRGMLGAALGVPRGGMSPVLDEVTFHVRVDRPGALESDFHTVSPPPPDLALVRQQDRRIREYSAAAGRADFVVPLGNGKLPWLVNGKVHTHISERHYLADAEFILAVTGPSDIVDELATSLHQPVFSPYLGRQAFAPQFPFHLGTRDGDGLTVLEQLPSTAPSGVLRVHAIGPGRPVQIARIDPPRTSTPLIDWRQP